MSLGVFLPNWVGDVVMATPALRALRRHFAGERLVGILRPHLAELLAGTEWFDELWPFDPRARQSGLGRWALVRKLRRARFDAVVLLTNSFHTALLAWLGGAKRRIGYVRDGRGLLLNAKVYMRQVGGETLPAPMVESYLALAEAVGCPPQSPRLELATTAAEEQLADEAWQSLGLADCRAGVPPAFAAGTAARQRVIALNCSGAYGAAKLWPVEHFAGLARRITDELRHDVLVVCGPQERDTALAIVACAERPRVFSLADQPVGLGLTKACLRRARLTVSTDSGPRHVAAAFDRPVITLLGPTLPVWIDNPTVRGAHVQLVLDCIGCGQRTCPLGHHRCMKDLSVETVFAAVVRLIEEEERRVRKAA
jgi:heptosyltransferase II